MNMQYHCCVTASCLTFFCDFLGKRLVQVDLVIHPAGKTCKSAGVCENLALRPCFYSCFTFPIG